jgi:membrane-associated protein
MTYHNWVYLILFLVIFIETGLVIMPLLPGDSLLFAAGTFCAGTVQESVEAKLNLWFLLILLIIAAITGDALNYYLGKKIGLKALKWKIKNRPLVKEKYLTQTHDFFDKHGAKAIVLARFVPIVRTFAPFVAGISEMKYSKFLRYNVIGGSGWVLLLTLSGYFFGNLEIVKNNFEIVIFSIIIISLLPMAFAYLKQRFRK